MEEIELPEGVNPEVIKHIMCPQNYGKLESPDGTGVGMDEKTGEFVIFTIQDGISDINFATNGCQETVVVGSMFTEMVKGKSVEYAKGTRQQINRSEAYALRATSDATLTRSPRRFTSSRSS